MIKWKPNEAYRKAFGVPYFDHLNVAILASGAPTDQAWLSKQTNVYGVSGALLEQMKKARPDAKLVTDYYAATSTNGIFMKVHQKPFDDVRVRRAMSMAIDRDGWGKTLQSPYKWESGPVTWGYPTWKLDVAKMPADVQKWAKYDVAEAKKLLDAAGIEKRDYIIHEYPYSATTTADCQLVVDSLSKIGLSTKLKVYEYNNWLATAYIGKYDDLLFGPDNLDRITQQLSDRLQAGSSRNHSDVGDDTTTKLLTDFMGAKGPAEAKPINDQLQTRSVDQVFCVYKPQGVSMHMWDAKLGNYGDNGDYALYYQDSYRAAFLWWNA